MLSDIWLVAGSKPNKRTKSYGQVRNSSKQFGTPSRDVHRIPRIPNVPPKIHPKAIRARRVSREPGAESVHRPSLTAEQHSVCDLQQSDREGTPNQRALVSKGSCTPSSDQKSVSTDSALDSGFGYNNETRRRPFVFLARRID